MANSARTALGHFLILAQVVSGSTATLGFSIFYQQHFLRPISQFLKIRSTSDSEGSGNLSIMAPLDFGCESDGTE
jgi:hypothetical protein